ncbi:DUF6441 family protein [Candidatus Williamhamiltonella defendens]|uniref:DUF6441 family protein n=1 Tax=Candidatus Williamhamiltonella defendens TaxID=138072 RepID=UPI00387E83E1
MRSGNAYFIQKNRKIILMAENISENNRQLSRLNASSALIPALSAYREVRKSPSA